MCAKEFPAVTLLGPRQSGKTTLAQMAFPDYEYLSFEDPDVRYQAQQDPRGLIASFAHHKGVILDEIQRVGDFLSYLQGVLDKQTQPGRFILTGSHQPSVHQAISQSLAGRTAVLELMPFSINELRQYKRPMEDPFELIVQGFYPRVHEHQIRPEMFYKSYVATYIERDVRALVNIKDLSAFDRFLHLLAGRIGQLVNYTSLANDVGVSSGTIKQWLSVLKASFVIFELPPYFQNIRKRVVKLPKIYFVDVGLAAWLLGLQTAQQIQRDPLRGNLFENLWIMEKIKAITHQGKQPNVYFYRDAKGAEVDLICFENQTLYAIEIKSAQTFVPEFLYGIRQFEKSIEAKYPIQAAVWYNGSKQFTIEGVSVFNPLLIKNLG